MKNLDLIWQFQEFENKKTDAEREMKKDQNVVKLRQLKTEIESAQDEIRLLLDKNAGEKNKLKSIEDDLAAIKEKIKRANDELYGGEITISRELESVQKSIAILKEKAQVAEDNALLVMDDIEQSDLHIKKLKKELEVKKNLFRELHKNHSEAKENLRKQLEEINFRQSRVVQQIDPAFFTYYQEFSQRFPDRVGVAVMQNGICSGCHMGISFEQQKQSKSDGKPVTCDNCGRMLLFK